eukprot:729421-Amorphochlora_amoeboformis.AAC.1
MVILKLRALQKLKHSHKTRKCSFVQTNIHAHACLFGFHPPSPLSKSGNLSGVVRRTCASDRGNAAFALLLLDAAFLSAAVDILGHGRSEFGFWRAGGTVWFLSAPAAAVCVGFLCVFALFALCVAVCWQAGLWGSRREIAAGCD